MIHRLSLTNFRNFSQKDITFSPGKNIIIWKNGSGKSNILEALALPRHSLVESHPKYLVAQGSNTFFLRYTLAWEELSVSYDDETHKKKYFLQTKSTTKKRIWDIYPHIISFHPMMMNVMYLSPSQRRSFLDEALIQAFPEYQKIVSQYKKILQNRNKLLHHISKNQVSTDELWFWNNEFIKSATQVYEYRKILIDFFSHHTGELEKYFFGKVKNISFSYISKTHWENPKTSLQEYIQENEQKEILLQKTLRGPHLDDFTILLDDIPLINFASRWEVKSIILWLKFLETEFIKTHSCTDNILFLIDDLLSELDQEHQKILWNHIEKQQSIITAIEDFWATGNYINL